MNDATCIADNIPIYRDFVNIFGSFKFAKDQLLKISEILTKKRNYDSRKSIILISDLMPVFSVLDFRADGYFVLEIRQADPHKFHFYGMSEESLRKHYFCDDSSK